MRSGKSLLAEELAAGSARPVYYLASMQILEDDPEQVRRLEIHQKRRPPDWKTVEACFAAHETIDKLEGSSFVIFDCLSLYITNILIATTSGGAPEDDPYLKERDILEAIRKLLDSISARPDIDFVIVSNETGWGVVPETKLGRAFRDFLGLANQMTAAEADRVYLSCAGLRLQLK